MVTEVRFEGGDSWTKVKAKSHTEAVREFISDHTVRGRRVETRERGTMRTYLFAVRIVSYVDVLLLGSEDGFNNDTFTDEAPITPIEIEIDPTDAI